MTEGAAEALQESTLIEELVESTTIEELESTVGTEAAEVVVEEIVRESIMMVPGHALHEKGLQRQLAVGTLVNSQQRRALAVPVINRGQTADKPRMNRWSPAGFVPPPVYIGFPLFVLAKRRSEQLFTVL